ncbi:4'-phosphopantetheinyl transferase superfamily protein [Streptomyces sp. NK15101]|uniref:4'-phosphopantetheinyl transferase family protein n=1 Tax=Streptomyces sp. NK15101 TaxID=2873261 RepID=UPI001CECEA36|nr:4'-phosphopantetheinyl transferase superfamily protein [Streptomyces sp. NK15101]
MAPPTGAGPHHAPSLHIHLAALSAVYAAAEQGPPELPEPERAALRDRYAPGRRRTQAQASRLLVRAVLSRATGLPAHRVSVVTDADGRPRPAGTPTRWPCFNVSHDSGLLALVLGTGPCGIDVEDTGEDALREVADRFCGGADRALLSEPDGARRLWAAKESVAKALGHGLRAGLSTIHFTGHPGRQWAEATWRGRPAGLRTRVVDLGGRHLAVTAATVPAAVRLSWWTPHHTGTDGRWELRPSTSTHARPLVDDDTSGIDINAVRAAWTSW